MLYGNVVAILSSGLICVVISLAQRKVYDWKEMNTHMNIVQADMSDKNQSRNSTARATGRRDIKEGIQVQPKGRRYLDFDLCSILANAFVLLWICV